VRIISRAAGGLVGMRGYGRRRGRGWAPHGCPCGGSGSGLRINDSEAHPEATRETMRLGQARMPWPAHPRTPAVSPMDTRTNRFR
jgi:hypothetical protein